MKKNLWLILITFFLNGCAGAQLIIGGLQMASKFTNANNDDFVNKRQIKRIIEKNEINGYIIIVGEGLCGPFKAKILFEETSNNYICYAERIPEHVWKFDNFLKMSEYEKKLYIIKTFNDIANFDLGPMPSDPKIATPNISNPLVQPASQPAPTPEPKSLSSNF